MDSNDKEPLMDTEAKRRLKCVLLGDGGVGKTSLLVSYLANGFPNDYVPTAFDNYNVSVKVDKKPWTVQFCDTAGQEDFDSLRPLCYPQTDVFLVCFSVMSPSSFTNVVERWLPEIRLHRPSARVILVGTHCDLRNTVQVLIELSQRGQRPVTVHKAQSLVKKARILSYIETSAVTQKNLKLLFDEAIMCGLRPPRIKKGSDMSGCICSVI